jgi:hypothetical protein
MYIDADNSLAEWRAGIKRAPHPSAHQARFKGRFELRVGG